MKSLRDKIILSVVCITILAVAIPVLAQGPQVVSEPDEPLFNQSAITSQGNGRFNSSTTGSGGQGAFGQGLGQIFKVAEDNGLTGKSSAKDILQNIVKWLLALVGMIATISLLYGGYLYITSQGEEDQAKRAKHIILYSVLGILLIGISAIVVNVVINVATG